MVLFSWEISNLDGSLGGTACMEKGSRSRGYDFRLGNCPGSGFLPEHCFLDEEGSLEKMEEEVRCEVGAGVVIDAIEIRHVDKKGEKEGFFGILLVRTHLLSSLPSSFDTDRMDNHCNGS